MEVVTNVIGDHQRGEWANLQERYFAGRDRA
jgi:hypothetical protein